MLRPKEYNTATVETINSGFDIFRGNRNCPIKVINKNTAIIRAHGSLGSLLFSSIKKYIPVKYKYLIKPGIITQ